MHYHNVCLDLQNGCYSMYIVAVSLISGGNWAEIELAPLVVIGTVYEGRWKFIYLTIMTIKMFTNHGQNV